MFTINDENNIVAFASAEEAAKAGDSTAISFDSQAGLAKLSGEWPLSRFTEVWNTIPGNTKVSKFADRKKAVARIWTVIQRLGGNDAAAPAPEPSAKKAKASKPSKAPKPAKKAAKAKERPAADRPNRKAEVIAMMKRAKGVMLSEIMEATGWQAHTVRGFVSILGSKGGETIESSKNASGERTYRIVK